MDLADKEMKEGSLENVKANNVVNYFAGVGHPHPISEGKKEMREMLLASGFDEIYTSYFVERKDIRELLGDLYSIFKDSIYHLSWIRPEPVGPTPDVDKRIGERFPDLDRAELWNILDSLDEDTSGEELLFTLRDDLGLDIRDAIKLVNMVPELRTGEPRTGMKTLRSFMPTSWFSTLEGTFDSERLPLRLFTMASAFRREPNMDSTHIETYNILSIAIADEDFSLDNGLSVLRKLFDTLELSDITFKEKSYPFPFFTDGSEVEIFGGDLELGTCGMVSKEVLDRLEIGSSVFLADIGVERVLMYRHGYPDIRELLYPQFYAAWNLSDEEIGLSLRYVRKPQTDFGKEIAQAIHSTYKEVRDCNDKKKVVAWKGVLVSSDYGKFLVSSERAKDLKIEGKKVEVVLEEAIPGSGLCGPGAFNEIWIEDGNVLGVPQTMSATMEEKDAYKTNKTLVKAFSRYAAWKIERALIKGRTGKKVEKIKDLEGINLKLTSKALYYMLSHKKKVNVQGPVFLKFKFQVS
jgi:O-phosphoseryl-tRNA synthetase